MLEHILVLSAYTIYCRDFQTIQKINYVDQRLDISQCVTEGTILSCNAHEKSSKLV